MIFNGDRFESDEKCRYMKNFFLDFFNGEETSAINLAGLEHVISLTATPDDRILFRTYSIEMKKSGLKTPRVELKEMGPNYDLIIKRTTVPKAEIWNSAVKVSKEVKPKKAKNVEVDEMGDKYGRIHLGKQEIQKIQTRKMKGLKRGPADKEDDESAKKQKVDDDEE
jgi:ribosome production factor 2